MPALSVVEDGVVAVSAANAALASNMEPAIAAAAYFANIWIPPHQTLMEGKPPGARAVPISERNFACATQCGTAHCCSETTLSPSGEMIATEGLRTCSRSGAL